LDALSVQGGFPLRGSVRANGSKFSVIPILAGTLLVNKEVRISSLPPISDAYTMLSSLYHIGAAVQMHRDTATIEAETINDLDVPDELVGSMRGNISIVPRASREERPCRYRTTARMPNRLPAFF